MVEPLLQVLRARLASRPPGCAAFALIDMAGLAHVDRADVILDQIRKAGALSVLQDERPDALLATPWLLPLPDHASARLLDRSCEWALRGPAVTWIASPFSADVLAHRLRSRTAAELPDQHPVLLRHFDPRVLPELLGVLHEPQRSAFLKLGHEWLYLDRCHALQGIALNLADEADAFQAPLLLDDRQFALLLAASEIDQLMPEMARAAPPEFMSLTVSQRVNLARACLSLAASWHLESLADKAMVGLLLLKLGEGFQLRPEWAPWLKELAQRRMSLLEVIERATTGQAA